nr:hypothetical protein [Tanacetum cinerariifolium]
MVQEFTGIPNAPFAATSSSSSPFTRQHHLNLYNNSTSTVQRPSYMNMNATNTSIFSLPPSDIPSFTKQPLNLSSLQNQLFPFQTVAGENRNLEGSTSTSVKRWRGENENIGIVQNGVVLGRNEGGEQLPGRDAASKGHPALQVVVGLGQRDETCTKPSNEMISCTIKGKPLVLSWGRTPRLDSGVRLSVIGAAKVSHFEILCRVHGIEPTVGLFRCFYVDSKNKGWMSFSKRQGSDAVCYTKPLDSLKGWNDHFFCIDAFACLALFSWHTSKSVSRDVILKSSEFGVEHYATFVAYPAPFHKYPEPFLCLVGMIRNFTLDEYTYPQFLRNDDEEIDLLSFIRTADLTKVRIGERQRNEDELKLLETTVGRVVPLLPVAPARSSSGRHGVGIQLVDVVAKTVVEDVAPTQPKRQKKRKTKVVDVGEPSHPAKKLRNDHGAPGGPTVSGNSVIDPAFIRWGCTKCRGLNIEEAEVDYVVRTSVSIITSATTITPTADSAVIAKEKLVGSYVFGADSSSAGESHPIPGGFSDCTSGDFLIGGIRTVTDPDSNLRKVYVPQWNVTNGSYLNDGGVCREMVDEFAPPKFFAERRRLNSIVEERDALLKANDEEIGSLKMQLVWKEAEAAEAICLRAEASNFEAVEKSLQGEVAALKECNNLLEAEKSGLAVKVADLAASVKVREQEVADLDVVVTSVKLQNDNLVDQGHKLEASSARLQEKVMAYENCLSLLEKFQDDQMREMKEKFNKLDTDLVEMTLHLEERFYPHLLTTISGRRWLITHGLKLAIAKCLNSIKYLSTLGVAISKAVEKGMQDELSAGITHGVEGRVLTDVAAYNPYAEADYLSALQQDSLAEKLGLTESQPHVDQLMVPIHHSPDQRVVGASALSLSLDVSSFRVRRIKENIAHYRSALCDVFVPLSEPLSVTALTGTKGTSNVTPATAGTTTALFVTLVSTSLIPPISTDDYEITHEESEKSVGADANPFLAVDNAELNIPQ